MHAQYFFINKCCNWQTVEAVCHNLPQVDAVPTFTFVIETVDSVDACRFVVATEYEEFVGIFDLEGKQQTDRFETLFSSIDIIAKKKVAGFRRDASILKEPQQIVILSVNIA